MSIFAISAVIPEISAVLATLVLLLGGVFQGDKAARSVSYTAVIIFLFTIAGLVAAQLGIGLDGHMVTANNFVISNLYTTVIKCLILVASAITLLMAQSTLDADKLNKIEYPIVMLLSVIGMMLMVGANNLLMLYVGLELQSLALYVLAAFNRDNSKSTESGLKYFVLGALASGLLLYGISLIYGFTGSLDFAKIAYSLNVNSSHLGATVGLYFVLAALAFKISAAPLHMWAPDVYEGAPTPVVSFFAVAPKLAALALMIRVLFGVFGDHVAEWQGAITALAMASLIVGAFGAIGQNNLKRLLAYSSIGHVGFILCAVAAVQPQSALLYMVFYMVMSLGAFAVVLLMRRQGRAVEQIADLAGCAKQSPLLAACMAVLMFSMAGIPPMVGFFTKLYIFVSLMQSGFIALAVFAALSSVVGAFYYIRVVKIMYMDEPAPLLDAPSDKPSQAVMVIASLVTLIGVVFISPVMDWLIKAVEGLRTL